VFVADRRERDGAVAKMLDLAHALLTDTADHVAACRTIDG
jgi:hypothetical protein